MQDLTVTLVQTHLVWENIDANLDLINTRVDGIKAPTDLIILPEMFSTGFSMDAQTLAEEMSGKTVSWMRAKAAEKDAVITGSVMVNDGGRFFNRLVWAQPQGDPVTYDKRHLFRYAGEEKIFTPGERHLTMEIKGWRIRPFICYDLRFPIWVRNLNLVYDLAVFVANWPARRAAHWRALLRARAIENQSFVAAVNRVGTDGNGFEYSGHSALMDPAGRVLFEEENTACTRTLLLKHKTLADYRSRFPAWMDADLDLLKVRAHPEIGEFGRDQGARKI
jgi:omega-amidase